MASVRLVGVSKQFGDHVAVAGLDLTIRDGELLVLAGPSGCGKTSTLRMVAGLEPVSGGDILVDDVSIAGVSPRARDVALVSQEPTLYPHMSVGDNLGFPLRMAGVRRSEVKRQVAEVAHLIGVYELLARSPSRLSGGQRQRVSMGRALIRRPELLLMDEPMSNLDAKLRTELRSVIGHLQHRLGVTTLYITHDQVEAMALGHRIGVMRTGRLVQCGAPDELYHRPVDAFVGSFIGTPPMNLLVGELASDSTGAAVTVASSVLRVENHVDLARHDGRAVIVGIRPQAFRFSNGPGLEIDVAAVDQTAGRTSITASIQAPAVTATSDGITVMDGPAPITLDLDGDDELDLELWRRSSLAVDPSDVHLFDVATGRSLRPEPTNPSTAR